MKEILYNVNKMDNSNQNISIREPIDLNIMQVIEGARSKVTAVIMRSNIN